MIKRMYESILWGLFVALLSACVGPGGAVDPDCLRTHSYRTSEPVYVTLEQMRTLEVLGPQPIVSPGKIYIHGSWLLINELDKGIHILDNSDIKNPQKLAFISVPGNHDLLVRQDTVADETRLVLYADNYHDLVALDITTPRTLKVLKRLEDVFGSFYPEPLPLPTDIPEAGEMGFIAEYREGEEVTETYNICSPKVEAVSFPAPVAGITSGDSTTPSQGGSLARFAALEDFLFTIDGYEIQSFRIADLANPTTFNRVIVDFGIETLFAYPRESGDQLYVGGNQGMYIMDASDPSNIRKQGEITHTRSCDPVVVQGDLAYVTLQGSCFGQSNRLEIIDVSDPTEPSLIVDYALQEPYGLGVDGDYLFVCDGAAGLKVYENARAPKELALLKQFSDVTARDIIPLGGHAIVIAQNGLYQYDYSAFPEGDMMLLSSIVVPEE